MWVGFGISNSSWTAITGSYSFRSPNAKKASVSTASTKVHLELRPCPKRFGIDSLPENQETWVYHPRFPKFCMYPVNLSRSLCPTFKLAPPGPNNNFQMVNKHASHTSLNSWFRLLFGIQTRDRQARSD